MSTFGSSSDPSFPEFILNMEIYMVNIPFQSDSKKEGPEKTPNAVQNKCFNVFA